MAVVDWLSPALSFAGAGLGALIVYRTSVTQDKSRRLLAAIDMLASAEPRKRALGRARVVELATRGGVDRALQMEALAVLREDVRAVCPEPVLLRLAHEGTSGTLRVEAVEGSESLVQGDRVLIATSLVAAASAYVEVAGGVDAAPDRVVALIAQAVPAGVSAGEHQGTAPGAGTGTVQTLPVDTPMIVVKLNPDVLDLSADELRERARKAWRLSLDRVRTEAPTALVAVVRGRVLAAWRVDGVIASAEPNRVEFILGERLHDLEGRTFDDTGQNPVRYWP
ncbi:hypothetical protein [Cellulomonas olei]|uniref:hypothetical protein n=1 Tax=Cellulomonas sp. P4 TaxID=3142533 RepID=UPI0031B9B131